MPFVSKAQRKFLFANHPSVAREFASKTPKGAKLPEHAKKKRKPRIAINNKLKEYGNERGGRIEINVKKHKGDRAELADTIHHEILHARHPKASEKTIQKKTKIDMSKMSYEEKDALTKKLRRKSINYKVGAAKRRFKISSSEDVEPGELINKFKSQKPKAKDNARNMSREKLSIMGLV